MVKLLTHDDAHYCVQVDDGDREWFDVDEIRLIARRGLPETLPQIGDAVWGQWKPNYWYHGRVVCACPIGYEIQFDDGDAAALPVELIAVDRAPAAAAVEVSTRVLAHWEQGKFFPGTITETGA